MRPHSKFHATIRNTVISAEEKQRPNKKIISFCSYYWNRYLYVTVVTLEIRKNWDREQRIMILFISLFNSPIYGIHYR